VTLLKACFALTFKVYVPRIYVRLMERLDKQALTEASRISDYFETVLCFKNLKCMFLVQKFESTVGNKLSQ
jgi:hypothetical protein